MTSKKWKNEDELKKKIKTTSKKIKMKTTSKKNKKKWLWHNSKLTLSCRIIVLLYICTKIRQTHIKSMKFGRTVHYSPYIQGRPHVGEKLLGFGSFVKLCIFQVYKLTLKFLFYLILLLVQINLAGLHHWMETFLQSVFLPVSCTNQHWNHCPLLTSMSPSYGRHKWWTRMAGYHKKGFFRILFLPL